jgi:hypothetical protein
VRESVRVRESVAAAASERPVSRLPTPRRAALRISSPPPTLRSVCRRCVMRSVMREVCDPVCDAEVCDAEVCDVSCDAEVFDARGV